MRVASMIPILGALLLGPALAWAAQPPAQAMSYQQIWGVPNSSGQVVIRVTIRVNGTPTTMTVTVPRGAITPFSPPTPMAGETAADYNLRYAAARGAASQAKAAVIASAINTMFGLTGANRVTTGTAVRTNQTYVVNRPTQAPYSDTQNLTLGTILIPNAARGAPSAAHPMGTEIEFVDLAGEGGRTQRGGAAGSNSGGYVPSPGTSAPRSTGFLQRTTPGVQTVATGLDALGDPSEVDFGIDGKFAAEVTPLAGMTDADILLDLTAQLNANGVAATYDPALVQIALTDPLPAGEMLDWGDTDTGLSLTAILGTSAVVPEPATWALLLGGLGVVGAGLRRRAAARG
ncbi:MAG: PEPxxWA-CTERM sorting domain-containing protein [Caulobacteraceae bacterium]|nr:PEPxxWA-CTERM sorting domain-containing protein [Caulobacteraceae bacterium]